ncbi:hypothetical protein M885DRAFT_580962 [Pelagophyceae sp. CCMP2097]|nr:hypothetical protein M885DRAFT_580962 [Pelagophyceae sp. CCMP2097]
MEPQMRSCVCKICQQVEYYLAAGHDHAQRRHKAQIQTYGKCATDEKIKWIAPPRAAGASKDATEFYREAFAASEKCRIAWEQVGKALRSWPKGGDRRGSV